MSELPSVKEQKESHIDFREDGGKILTAANVKKYYKELGFSVGSDFTDALTDQIFKMMWRAGQRCRGNNRKTLKPVDL